MGECTLHRWRRLCVETSRRPADLYSGARKIHRGVTADFDGLDDSLEIEDCGFTRTKLGMLRRLYWSDDHAAAVAELWRARVAKERYGSVSVSTYHHLTKADPAKRSKRASVMGPCLVGVGLTLVRRGEVAVDVWYRTTELFKKFPADLVFLRTVVLPAFDLDPTRVRLRCHFANVTSHPMYAVTWIPHLSRPVPTLDSIAREDRRFYDWILKWTGRYICPEHHRGIAKFAQAQRVKMDALRRITGDQLAELQKYVRDNHPGYRAPYEETSDDDEDDGE